MAKRGQNEGSIYKRKDGRWTAVLNLGYQNGKLKRKSFYGKTREEVSGKLVGALNDQQKGLPIITERQTTKQFLERWLTDCVKPSVRPKTFVSYSQLVRVHITPALGHIQLDKLSPQHVQKFMNERLEKGFSAKTKKEPTQDIEKGLSPRTVQYLRAVLRKALGQALKWGLVARNVATLVDPPRVERAEIKFMLLDEAQKFLKAIEGDRLEALFSTALAMGLRQGEALGLRWQDIDWNAQIMRVRYRLRSQAVFT